MSVLELAYAHFGETVIFAFLILAIMAMAISGVIGVIAAFRGNYNNDETP